MARRLGGSHGAPAPKLRCKCATSSLLLCLSCSGRSLVGPEVGWEVEKSTGPQAEKLGGRQAERSVVDALAGEQTAGRVDGCELALKVKRLAPKKGPQKRAK